jgi:hypothetical protein
MTRRSPFIKLHPRFLILHRLQKSPGLALAHLAFLVQFGLGRLR